MISLLWLSGARVDVVNAVRPLLALFKVKGVRADPSPYPRAAHFQVGGARAAPLMEGILHVCGMVEGRWPFDGLCGVPPSPGGVL